MAIAKTIAADNCNTGDGVGNVQLPSESYNGVFWYCLGFLDTPGPKLRSKSETSSAFADDRTAVDLVILRLFFWNTNKKYYRKVRASLLLSQCAT